jgi:spermidine synthase
VLLALVACSGFAALVYEVLWLKELRLLFGNTSHAAAATLSVFFGGLALGGYIFARVAPRITSPLRVYAFLEAGIALSALLYFGLLSIYAAAYAPMFAVLGGGWSFTFVKILLVALLLLPGATLMGGTLPVIAQLVVRSHGALASAGALLYGVNTVGGVAGVVVAGFVLPPLIGFQATYVVAIAVSLAVAAVAFVLSRSAGGAPVLISPARPVAPSREGGRPTGPRMLMALAALTGFVALAMEVLWTRMLAQVFQNSVYSFAVILVVFLSAIAVGSFVARRLARFATDGERVLRVLMIAAGVAVALTPLVFYAVTDGMAPIVFTSGLVHTTWIALVVIFPAGVLMCLVFPYLLRLVEGAWSPGTAIGLLSSANTLGGVAGSLFTGFVLLEMVGPWAGSWVLAALYPLALAVRAVAGDVTNRRRAIAPGAVGFVMLVAAFAIRLPDVRIDVDAGDAIEAVLHGSGSTVTVVSRRGEGGSYDLVMKMNNWYGLGSVSGVPNERRLAHLPLLLHPNPRSVFFLGMATGITAGASLAHPVDRVVVCELSGEVVEAAREHFARYAGGLFSDPRVAIVIEDGRAYLAGTAERFDVIVGDLFLPWASGTGSLFTREHFGSVRKRLRRGGVFAQWLPLYQMTEREFMTIVRTALDVFDTVTLWRGNFSPGNPMVALVCEGEGATLDGDVLARNTRGLIERGMPRGEMVDLLYGGVTAPEAGARAFMSSAIDQLVEVLPFAFYAVNASANASLFEGAGINTDDMPLIEYRAPLAPGGERMGFIGEGLAAFQRRLSSRVAPERDPYLVDMAAARTSYVRAGLDYFEANVFKEAGRMADAQARLAEYMQRIGAAMRGPVRAAGPPLISEPERAYTLAEEASSLAVALVADGPEHATAGRVDLPGTRTVVVRVRPGGESRVDGATLTRWGAEGGDAYGVALANVWQKFRCEPREYSMPGGGRVILLAGEHRYVSAHALMLDRYPDLIGERGALVAVPNRDALIVSPVGSGDVLPTARRIATTAARMAAAGEMPVSESMYWYEGGRFVLVPCERDGNDVRVELPAGLR